MTRNTSVVIALALAFAAQPGLAEYKLNILHINDLHSRIEPINRFDSTCGAEDDAEGKCFGGVARVATKINELRNSLIAAGENVIVVDAGDQFQGSLMYSTYKGAAAAEFMNAIGFDAMAVGNHEFDDGPEALAKFIDSVDVPVISGNLELANSDLLRDRVADHLVLEVGGKRIGLISAVATDTDETSSPGPNVGFVDEVAAMSEDAANLEAQGVDIVIGLTHVGLPADMRIAANVPGIDAVVGGHSHTYLSASDEDASGPYPVWVDGMGGNQVPVMQAYAYSKYVGHAVLEFDEAGNLTSASGDTILLDASVVPDAAIATRVGELAGPIEELKNQVVGEAGAEIEGSREQCRAVECEMGNLVSDAILDLVRDNGFTIAIQNGGGLRASIDAGEVTMGEVLTVLPFQNTIATFRVSGQTVIDALENGVSQVEEQKGRFPQVAGLRYVWDPTVEPNGGRIQEVLVMEGGEWKPIDVDAIYGVVSNNYVRNGGDGYKMFIDAAEAYDFGPGLEETVADYIATNSPYQPYLDGRIQTK